MYGYNNHGANCHGSSFETAAVDLAGTNGSALETDAIDLATVNLAWLACPAIFIFGSVVYWAQRIRGHPTAYEPLLEA